MDISFKCDRCGQNLVVDETGAGETVPCPNCGQQLLVPVQKKTETPASQVSNSARVPPAPAASKRPAMDSEPPQQTDPTPPPDRPKLRLKLSRDAAGADVARVEKAGPEQTGPEQAGPEQEAPAGDSKRVVGPPQLASWDAISHLPLTSQQRTIGFAVLAMLVLLALALSFKTAILSLALAVVISSTLARGVGVLVTRHVPSFHAVTGAFAAACLILGLTLLLVLPRWQWQGEAYGARMVELAEMVTGKVDTAVGASAQKPEAIGSKPADSVDATVAKAKQKTSQWLGSFRDATKRGITWFNEATRSVVAMRRSVYVQLSLLIGAALAIPLLLPLLPAVGQPLPAGRFARFGISLRSDLLNFMCKVSHISANRVVKSLALTLITIIGLSAARNESPVFLAGWTLVCCLMFRPGYSVALTLAILVVPMAQGVTHSAVAIVVTWVVSAVVEKWLHWTLYVRPALAAGLILPETHGPRQGRTILDFIGGGLGLLRMAVSLALLWVVAMVASTLWSHARLNTDRREAVSRAAYTLASGEADKATGEYKRLLDIYPDDPEVLLGLVKSNWKAKKPEEARLFADKLAAWTKPESSHAAPFGERVYQVLAANVGYRDAPVNRAEGYEFIVARTFDTAAPDPKAVRPLAEKLLSLDASNTEGHRVLAWVYMTENNVSEAETHARQALEFNPRAKGVHAILAEMYFSNKEWLKSIVECDSELEVDPNDTSMQSMKALATKALRR